MDSYDSLKSIGKPESDVFEFRKPDIDELIGVFQQCHQIIWKKHKVPPKLSGHPGGARAEDLAK